ncbi:MAG: hypothetical protein NTY98_05180 [Verrucomicrobia bacterium]|nr:hypothetical protein [Verrucomicrobiota bacterium]
MSLDAATRSVFDRVYSTELVYEPDCWKLCGDAHCCHFTRHKAKFRMMAKGDTFQEIPLLPGEWEYLSERGWTAQFGDHEFRASTYEAGGREFRVESVISRRPMCACEHGTRTTICRLYPVLPVYDVYGRVIATEVLGTYEELEKLDSLEPLCKISAAPLAQVNIFLELANIIGSHPVLLVYLRAYHATKRHVFDRLGARLAAGESGSAFQLFERGYLRRQLLQHDELRASLAAIIDDTRVIHGGAFDDAWRALHGTSV